MRLPFTKMHGIGNDYVYVDAFRDRIEDPAAVARLVSPRHTGIGSDGLILIAPSQIADCRMEMYNADGSRGEMCGNGIRCVGKYAYEHGLVEAKDRLRIETDAGVKELELHLDGKQVVEVTVDMGVPSLEPRDLPAASEGPLVDATLAVENHTVSITCVSMGNPHCVLFVDAVDTAPVLTLGPLIEQHPLFPRRVNVEFVELLEPAPAGRLRMRVWERGSGETAACGTGACAAAVAAVVTGRGRRAAQLVLNGGDLHIEWRESDGHVTMRGGATEVFSGEIEL